MLGDTAVAVHPDDERYKASGRQDMVRLPLTGRLIPIIADEYSDPEKGTGAVKITPGHDFNDFEVGKRHNLPLINILNKDGTLNDDVPRGLSRAGPLRGAQDGRRRSGGAGACSTRSNRSPMPCRMTKRPRPSCSSRT